MRVVHVLARQIVREGRAEGMPCTMRARQRLVVVRVLAMCVKAAPPILIVRLMETVRVRQQDDVFLERSSPVRRPQHQRARQRRMPHVELEGAV